MMTVDLFFKTTLDKFSHIAIRDSRIRQKLKMTLTVLKSKPENREINHLHLLHGVHRMEFHRGSDLDNF